MESEETIPHDLPKFSKTTIIIVGIVAVLFFAGLFVLGIIPHLRQHEEQDAKAQKISDEKPKVRVVKPTRTGKDVPLNLPADLRAYGQAALYARINGYLNHWNVDIRDRVKKGDLLAVIDAPDTDADLAQAEANLAQTKANVIQQQTNYELADRTYQRFKGLIPTGGVTQQQLDQYESSMDQAKASLNAAQASVTASEATAQRFKALQGFEKIYAPFDGVITARNYDSGALISSSNIAAGQELFDIAEDDWLRVYINVPQEYATVLKYDRPVDLTLDRNYPGKVFHGWIKRSADVLDPSTRTLRTELDFPNSDHLLLAGMYGEAKLEITRNNPVLTVPTSTMLFEADGTQVAVVGADSKIHFRKIKIGRDFGAEMEVLTGLDGSEQLVANPGEKLAENVEVDISNSDDGKDKGSSTQHTVADQQAPGHDQVAQSASEQK